MKFNFSNKGQVSTELLVGVLILFVFLMIVFVQNSYVSNSTQLVGTIYLKQGDCLRLAFAISKVNTEGLGAQMVFELTNDANIISSQKLVMIGENYCKFIARTNNTSLSPGIITLRNYNGVVEFS